MTVSDAKLRSLAFLADVPPDDTDDFVTGMKSIVPMPLESVMQTLCAVNYILNGERVSLADLTIYDELQTNFSSQMASERVERLNIGSDPSQLIAAVSNYIQHHISESVTTEAIAQSLYISRTHLSARFHKETGMTLSDFILKEKTEEAKSLLRYT